MSRALVLTSSVLAMLAMLGCEGATTSVDSRFATPERTVETLLASYGLEGVSQEDVRARLAAHARFQLVDREGFEACFSDLAPSPAGEGLAGWVLGALAAGKDELRTEMLVDRATVSPREGVRIVLHRAPSGEWRIVLADSVPLDVARGISALAESHDQRLRQTGIRVE